MVWAIIITAICFAIGNVVWEPMREPKIFWVPLAVLLFLYQLYICKREPKANRTKQYFLIYILLLAAGNIVKQVFYTKTIGQINDYIWGGLLTIGLIAMLIWENRHKLFGRK